MSDKVLTLVKTNIVICLLIVVMFGVSGKILLMDFPIIQTNFSEIVLGKAAVKNIDIKSLISWYMIYAIPLSGLMAYLLHRNGYYDAVLDKIQNVKFDFDEKAAFVGVLVIGQLLMGQHNWVSFSIILSLFVAWFYLHRYKVEIDKVDALAAWLCSIVTFSIPVLYLGQYAGARICFGMMAVALAIYICRKARIKNFYGKFWAKLFPFQIAAIGSFVILAILEIILLRDKAINDSLLLAPFVIAFFYNILNRKSLDREFDNKIFACCVCLLVFTYLPSLGQTGDIDFFEGANHGLSIQNAIMGTGIPIINNLDAHMLYNTLPGIIYYAFTGDYIGAMFAPYAYIVSTGLSVFFLSYLLRRYFTDKETLILVALLPWGEVLIYFVGAIVWMSFEWWCKVFL